LLIVISWTISTSPNHVTQPMFKCSRLQWCIRSCWMQALWSITRSFRQANCRQWPQMPSHSQYPSFCTVWFPSPPCLPGFSALLCTHLCRSRRAGAHTHTHTHTHTCRRACDAPRHRRVCAREGSHRLTQERKRNCRVLV
jgi:hypothetical protein